MRGSSLAIRRRTPDLLEESVPVFRQRLRLDPGLPIPMGLKALPGIDREPGVDGGERLPRLSVADEELCHQVVAGGVGGIEARRLAEVAQGTGDHAHRLQQRHLLRDDLLADLPVGVGDSGQDVQGLVGALGVGQEAGQLERQGELVGVPAQAVPQRLLRFLGLPQLTQPAGHLYGGAGLPGLHRGRRRA